jgi:hypothetical protein
MDVKFQTPYSVHYETARRYIPELSILQSSLIFAKIYSDCYETTILVVTNSSMNLSTMLHLFFSEII